MLSKEARFQRIREIYFWAARKRSRPYELQLRVVFLACEVVIDVLFCPIIKVKFTKTFKLKIKGERIPLPLKTTRIRTEVVDRDGEVLNFVDLEIIAEEGDVFEPCYEIGLRDD